MRAAPSAAEPVRGAEALSAALVAEALSDVRRWAPRRLAVLLGGSAATGEDVWRADRGRAVTLSDLDLYVVVPDARARDAARACARGGLAAARARAQALGLEAELETAFFTPGDLAALPARPATIELRRAGRVLEGDRAWRERVPAWAPGDVGREERLLLLENRAFELLWARPRLAGAGLTALRARHAVLKAALDLAGAACLAAGEYPPGAAARVARARALGGPHVTPALDAAWTAALAWRAGGPDTDDAGARREEWQVVALAWTSAWRAEAGDADPGDPASVVRHAARRARLRRRLRLAVFHADRSGRGPRLVSRLRAAGAGTPQHRVNATGALLLAALAAGGGPAAPPLLRALGALGVLRPADGADLEALAGAAVRAWDTWVLDGQRTGGAEGA